MFICHFYKHVHMSFLHECMLFVTYDLGIDVSPKNVHEIVQVAVGDKNILHIYMYICIYIYDLHICIYIYNNIYIYIYMYVYIYLFRCDDK